MAGKKSAKALSREEGEIFQGLLMAKPHADTDMSARSGAYRQRNEADELARCANDQPEELLHVRPPDEVLFIPEDLGSYPGAPCLWIISFL
jgi:hypothetical protein